MICCILARKEYQKFERKVDIGFRVIATGFGIQAAGLTGLGADAIKTAIFDSTPTQYEQQMTPRLKEKVDVPAENRRVATGAVELLAGLYGIAVTGVIFQMTRPERKRETREE